MINNKINEIKTLLQVKACLRRYVFTRHLKFDRESRLDISPGRLFQSFGAAKQNALPPSVGSFLPLGTSSIPFLLALRGYPVE